MKSGPVLKANRPLRIRLSELAGEIWTMIPYVLMVLIFAFIIYLENKEPKVDRIEVPTCCPARCVECIDIADDGYVKAMVK